MIFSLCTGQKLILLQMFAVVKSHHLIFYYFYDLWKWIILFRVVIKRAGAKKEVILFTDCYLAIKGKQQDIFSIVFCC